MEAPDNHLLTKAVQGDRAALIELLKRHGPTARARLAGRIPKRWQAVLSEDDVMQQTYADAYARIQTFISDNECAFSSWLDCTARRNLSDALKMLAAGKRGGRCRQVPNAAPDASCGALLDLLTGGGTTPSHCAARGEATGALQRAIAELPEVYARVVALYDLEGRPVQEVAEALQRSPGAVFMLRARAHERLHEILGRTSEFFSGPA